MVQLEDRSPGVASTVDKALDLLFALHARGAAAGLSDLARALQLPKSSVHRLLRILVGRGLIEQDARGHYRPGFALVALGLGVLKSDPVVAAARPVLEDEAGVLGETVFLTAARAGRVAVLDKVEGSGFLRAAPQVGGTVPVHATAVGKLYLAFAPEQVAEPDLSERYTAHTARDARRLAREVARARERGWAVNREEWIAGLSVVAAPLRSEGRMVAALALASATPRLDELGVERVGCRLIAAAERTARRLMGEAR